MEEKKQNALEMGKEKAQAHEKKAETPRRRTLILHSSCSKIAMER